MKIHVSTKSADYWACDIDNMVRGNKKKSEEKHHNQSIVTRRDTKNSSIWKIKN